MGCFHSLSQYSAIELRWPWGKEVENCTLTLVVSGAYILVH